VLARRRHPPRIQFAIGNGDAALFNRYSCQRVLDNVLDPDRVSRFGIQAVGDQIALIT
jgi:hypothetical protein